MTAEETLFQTSYVDVPSLTWNQGVCLYLLCLTSGCPWCLHEVFFCNCGGSQNAVAFSATIQTLYPPDTHTQSYSPCRAAGLRVSFGQCCNIEHKHSNEPSSSPDWPTWLYTELYRHLLLGLCFGKKSV